MWIGLNEPLNTPVLIGFFPFPVIHDLPCRNEYHGYGDDIFLFGKCHDSYRQCSQSDEDTHNQHELQHLSWVFYHILSLLFDEVTDYF